MYENLVLIAYAKKSLINSNADFESKARTGDFQQCGMCVKQSLRSDCAYAQTDQSLC